MLLIGTAYIGTVRDYTQIQYASWSDMCRIQVAPRGAFHIRVTFVGTTLCQRVAHDTQCVRV